MESLTIFAESTACSDDLMSAPNEYVCRLPRASFISIEDKFLNETLYPLTPEDFSTSCTALADLDELYISLWPRPPPYDLQGSHCQVCHSDAWASVDCPKSHRLCRACHHHLLRRANNGGFRCLVCSHLITLCIPFVQVLVPPGYKSDLQDSGYATDSRKAIQFSNHLAESQASSVRTQTADSFGGLGCEASTWPLFELVDTRPYNLQSEPIVPRNAIHDLSRPIFHSQDFTPSNQKPKISLDYALQLQHQSDHLRPHLDGRSLPRQSNSRFLTPSSFPTHAQNFYDPMSYANPLFYDSLPHLESPLQASSSFPPPVIETNGLSTPACLSPASLRTAFTPLPARPIPLNPPFLKVSIVYFKMTKSPRMNS